MLTCKIQVRGARNIPPASVGPTLAKRPRVNRPERIGGDRVFLLPNNKISAWPRSTKFCGLREGRAKTFASPFPVEHVGVVVGHGQEEATEGWDHLLFRPDLPVRPRLPLVRHG